MVVVTGGVVAVHYYDDPFVGEAAFVDVDAVFRHEVLERAAGNDVVSAAPVEELCHEIVGLVLEGGAAFGGKGADGVAGEAAGEVAAHEAVAFLLGSVHEDFGAVVDLRNAARGEKERYGLLPPSE